MEEAIRFLKQSDRLEDLRLLDDERLRNLAALVMAAASCAAGWLGESLALAVFTSRVRRGAKRCLGVPEFHSDALAHGISVLPSRWGVWGPPCRPSPASATPSQQRLCDFA